MSEQIFFDIAVDIDSLSSFIEESTNLLSEQIHETPYTKKVRHNLADASKLILCIEKKNNNYFFTDVMATTDSGCVYGQTFSSLSTEVKEALLGNCSKLSIKESSYSILTSLALTINPNLIVSSLKEFIRHRDEVCNNIAMDIFTSKIKINQLFSVIDLTDNSVSDVNKYMISLLDDSYNEIISHCYFNNILSELFEVKHTLLHSPHFKDDNFEIDGFTFPKSNSNKLQWIHQAFESFILNKFVELIPAQYEPIILDKNCVYLKHSLPSDIFVDLKLQIRELFPLVDFKKELVFPIHTRDYINPTEQQHYAEIKQHKQRIEHDTQLAAEYKSLFCHTATKKES